MGYVRTKDGRIGKATHEDNKNYRAMFGRKCPLVSKDDVIKTADTIEELCDEAVFFDDKNKPHYQSQEGNIWYLGAGLYTKTLRFGIFTDKGLIYVAKMNEKGELELL